MRELTVIGLDVDGRRVIFEGRDAAEKFTVSLDDRLRAAVSGERTRSDQTTGQNAGPKARDIEVRGMLRPKDIQARIRAGASVEQLAESSGTDIARIERFAHPVLLERQRAAELATAAHPVLADGPAVLTLLETVTMALMARGLDADETNWDAWRNEDGRWTVQMAWQAGLSDNVAHFRFTPGAHGGIVTALDDSARELIDPTFERQLRPVAAVAQLAFDTPPLPPAPQPAPPAERQERAATPEPAVKTKRSKPHPTVPGWEDVLLGVRSGGER